MLAQFHQARTPLGDRARLAADDPAWPDVPDRLQTHTDHMERAGAAAFITSAPTRRAPRMMRLEAPAS